MLESSSLPENPGAGDPENAGSGHRWPRKETMALLEIRSSMDAKFRDSSAKAPLWEEVSRKMGEFGFSRSGKKCKEKFENIYKYHKRTRDGRSARSNGKAYRFFDQLEALDHRHNSLAGSETGHLGNVIFDAVPCSVHKPFADLIEGALIPSTSSSSSSSGGESELESDGKKEEKKKRKQKKRKLTEFFERLMKEVVERQESLQRTFVEALEKCERDRVAREEAWKTREAERVKRETESLARERSIAAQKDAAVLAFLKKLAKDRSIPETAIFPAENACLAGQEKSQDEGFPGTGAIPEQPGDEESPTEKTFLAAQEMYESRGFSGAGSTSRWPKEEVDALIRLRTELDTRYQENAPKGPLWDEISAGMEKLGYERSSKRCKEKWENINKYFKRVKEGNKRRYVHSRTCPYFDQLDALYSKKAKTGESSADDSGCDFRPEELLMHMMGVQQGEEEEEVDRQVNDDGSLEIENLSRPIEAPQNDTAGGSSDQRVLDTDASMDNMG